MDYLKAIYKKLYSYFGPQGWWPVTREGTAPKYFQSNNLTERQKLEICFGAILAQNTNWKNVEKAVIELNRHDLIDVKKIAKIDNKKLAKIIISSGYNNQKAKKLKNISNFLLKNYKGNLSLLLENEIKELREQLLSVNGIGPETADSIILYAAKKPIFVIDAYTQRVLNRLGFKEKTYEELQNLLMSRLPKNERLFNEYHALLVELGKNICRKNPICDKCPINMRCSYYKNIYIGR